MIDAERGLPVVFGSAMNVIVPSPCPVPLPNEIQLADVEALQPHVASIVTAALPLPPARPNGTNPGVADNGWTVKVAVLESTVPYRFDTRTQVHRRGDQRRRGVRAAASDWA